MSGTNCGADALVPEVTIDVECDALWGNMNRPVVHLVLPCLDEAVALPVVLGGLPPGYAAVVVDNGSVDGSAEIALTFGAIVIQEGRKGYGAAVNAGLAACTADIVAVLDCDGSIDPADLVELVSAVAQGRSDLACGRRRPVGKGAWPWHARWGNTLLAGMLRRKSGVQLHDLAPVRVARRADLVELGVLDRRSGYTVETLLRAGRAGWRITEHDIAYHPRAAGSRSKVTGSVRGTVTALLDIAALLLAEEQRLQVPLVSR